MSNEIHGFGFGGRNNHKKENQYLNRFVCVNQNGNSVLGILDEIDTAKGCAKFMPSIVGKGDGSLAIVEDEYTTMDFPLPIIRPMSGTIEEYVEDYNNELKRKRAKNGDE
jgi:hypothetical protein